MNIGDKIEVISQLLSDPDRGIVREFCKDGLTRVQVFGVRYPMYFRPNQLRVIKEARRDG